MLSSMSLSVLLMVTGQPLPPPMTVDQVVARMLEMDEVRRAELQNYTSVRHYSAGNKRFNKHAEMTVRMTNSSPGGKRCDVISEKGSAFIRARVLKKVIDAEVEAAAEQNGNRSRIIPENYDFELLGSEDIKGRPSYVIQITPRTSNKFLVRGRIWVDSEDFAIVRLEGSPAKNPSFWTTEVRVTHEYEKHGQFWLPRSNFSESKIRLLGKSELRIEYLEYNVNAAPPSTGGKQ